MTLTRSFPTQHPSGLPITDTRRVTAGLVVRNADGTPRPGVFPAHANALVTGRASMGYDVAPFLAATSRINTGVELIANDAVTVVATTAAPASNSRIDVIWVRSQFVQHADANNDVVFGVTQGTAALTPTKPAIPAGALELATAEILSTTTQTSTVVITQTHPYTAGAGGVVWLRNATEQTAFVPPVGTTAWRIDLGTEVRYEAAGWRTLRSGLQLIQRIPFTAATSVVFDGFSSLFDNYHVVLDVNSSSATAGGTIQMRTAGVNNTSANYAAQQAWDQGATHSAIMQTGLTSFPVVPVAGSEISALLEFYGPQLARVTRMSVDAQVWVAPNNAAKSTSAGRFNATTVFDGFVYTPSAGNVTGTLSVYGRA